MKVFEPIEIKGMKLKNRIGLAPLLNMPRAADWGVSDQTIKWFEARARGGTGFLMTGAIVPAVLGPPDAVERFAKLADAVHAHGAKLGVQITGMGGAFMGLGASASPFPDDRHPKQTVFDIEGMQLPPIQAMTVEQIQEQIEQISSAAAALKTAGVDCVELHCAHGGATLQCNFISPFYNRREDDYGGSWENRLRYPTETIKKMREKVGDDYPIFVRISADELLGKDGITLEDTVSSIVPALEQAGVDCFDVSQGSITHSPEGIEIPMYYPRGCYIHNAAAVKEVTKLPVIGVGRITDLDMAERFLQEGKADIIYMGRQLTADPETPNKYSEGRSGEIRRCLGCLEGCGTPCPINYDISPDAVPLTQAEKPKKILIIGGGVAGMEAARICALRGHKITLMEKEPQLGGTVAALALDPLAVEFRNIVDYLDVQMRKLAVDVQISKEAGPADIEALKPDAVIVATGANLRIPEVAQGKPGVIDHLDALRKRNTIGHRVVVWGLMYGAELAISLAEDGKEVVLIGEAGEKTLASHAGRVRKWWIIRKLVDFNVVRAQPEAAKLSNPRVLYSTRVEDITPEGISIVNTQGEKSILAYDTLIVSRGREKNDAIAKEIEGKVPEIHLIGDCSSAGNIQKAIWSANEMARKI